MTMMQWCCAIAKRMMSTGRITMPSPSASPVMLSSSLSSSSSSAAQSASELIVCGRGDKKTKRGKRFKGSYGNARPNKKKMIQRIKDKVEVPREFAERLAVAAAPNPIWNGNNPNII
ncbi:hypothetical protein Ancab_027358 [Ancistrocladus abbreviatus]